MHLVCIAMLINLRNTYSSTCTECVVHIEPVASGNDVAPTSADDASDDNDENSISNSSNATVSKKKKAVAAAVASGPVFAQLPSKTEVVTWVSLSCAQRSMYEGTFLSTFLRTFFRAFFVHRNCKSCMLRRFEWRCCAVRHCALMALECTCCSHP
jgi:hypothetical protein